MAKKPRSILSCVKVSKPDATPRTRQHVADAGGPPQSRKTTSTVTKGRGYTGWQCTSAVDRQAAYAVARLLAANTSRTKGSSVKSLTLAPQNVAKAATHAVVCQTLKFLPVILKLIAAVGLQTQFPQLTQATAAVLVYEVLFGEGVLRTGKPGRPEQAVLANQAALTAQLDQLLQDAGVEDVAGLLETHQPTKQHLRFARVNTLKMTVQEALLLLRSPQAGQPALQSAGQDVQVDDLLPDVLVFPSGTDLHAHPLVRSGGLILQSKASCMPAHVLAPEYGWTVLDACAAPGNKTTHVAALLGGGGQVVAVDRDPKRLELLRSRAAAAGATSVTTKQADFLSLDLTAPEFAEVRGVVLDPSCSGSGTVYSRMDHLLPTHGCAASDPDFTDDRIEALAQFQEAALRHALTLPGLQRLVYSTCSLYVRENEAVIQAVMPAARACGFELGMALPSWPRRGLPVLPEARLLIRTDPMLDGMDGFFVAMLERVNIGKAG